MPNWSKKLDQSWFKKMKLKSKEYKIVNFKKYKELKILKYKKFKDLKTVNKDKLIELLVKDHLQMLNKLTVTWENYQKSWEKLKDNCKLKRYQAKVWKSNMRDKFKMLKDSMS